MIIRNQKRHIQYVVWRPYVSVACHCRHRYTVMYKRPHGRTQCEHQHYSSRLFCRDEVDCTMSRSSRRSCSGRSSLTSATSWLSACRTVQWFPASAANHICLVCQLLPVTPSTSLLNHVTYSIYRLLLMHKYHAIEGLSHMMPRHTRKLACMCLVCNKVTS